ncbi:hypothetical protein M408DRAFT_332244 [Serendipita vermifera MAFF 305830]|uniref:Uncharacterized protein n=1 Tax=Serendipita vermifera MAFF 305830 TaxID=933852 RepID=A0A0C3AG79_SERVB|nr:hypothetical protein M408DRAFT_332244 [Serendipita vermifera MAFF 305830]
MGPAYRQILIGIFSFLAGMVAVCGICVGTTRYRRWRRAQRRAAVLGILTNDGEREQQRPVYLEAWEDIKRKALDWKEINPLSIAMATPNLRPGMENSGRELDKGSQTYEIVSLIRMPSKIHTTSPSTGVVTFGSASASLASKKQ